MKACDCFIDLSSEFLSGSQNKTWRALLIIYHERMTGVISDGSVCLILLGG